MFYNYPIDISTQAWVEVLRDKNVTTESDFEVLRIVFESENHEITASEIAAMLNKPHHGELCLQIYRFSKRVIKKTGAHPSLKEDGKPRWWHVPFLGYERGGKCPWIMRPELVAAFEAVYGKTGSDCVRSGEIIKDSPTYAEGKVTAVRVNRYERNRHARSQCIAHYGSRCVICGFDFEEVYGPIGKDKIHVHHLVPLSKVKEEYEVDPIRDLRPVCPNCHLIIHSTKEPLTIEEVRGLIRRR